MKTIAVRWREPAPTIPTIRFLPPRNFFINMVDNNFLNFRSERPDSLEYYVLTEVTDGLDVVNKTKGVATSRSGMHQDVPKDDVIITYVTIAE